MALNEEDKHVIKFLRQSKHYGAKRFLKEFPRKSWSRSGLNKIISKIDRTGTLKHLPGSGRPLTTRTDSIAANHSDFGGILPLFTQYSAIPIGMTKFRQN